MQTRKKTIALLITASLGLAGCLNDPYDGYDNGGTGPNPGPGPGDDNALSWGVDLYRTASSDEYKASPFVMTLTDHLGTDQAVTGSDIELDNVQLTGDTTEFAPLHIAADGKTATLHFSADEAFDLSTTYNGNNSDLQAKTGTLQFDIQPVNVEQPVSFDGASTPPRFYLTMGSGETTAKVDITSAVVASMGSTIAQHIRVPMQCFEQQGVDMTKVDMAFALETQGAVDYRFSAARLIANSQTATPGQANVLACETSNVVINEETSVIAKRFKAVDGETPAPEGWATKLVYVRGEQISPSPNQEPIAYDGIHYKAGLYVVGQPSILIHLMNGDLSTIETPRSDLSHYVENGTLNFKLFIPGASTPAQDDLKLRLRFETPTGAVAGTPNKGYHHSYDVDVDLSTVEKNKEIQVSLPVKDFFTNAKDNKIRHNSAQFVEKMVSYVVGPEANTDLTGMRYGISDVHLLRDAPVTPQP